MSGALSSVASLAGGGIGQAVQGLLQATAWRGVSFDMLDSRHSAGRRWVQFLFPGRGDTLQEDLGAMDGPIEINGLLIGDDWLRRQRRIEAACKAPGPSTLLHPWLGEIKCVLVGPAEFGFDHQRQGVCTVTLRFQVWQERQVAPASSLGRLLDAVDAAIDSARLYLAGVLAPLGDALGLLGLAQSVLARVSGVWDGLLGSSPAGTGTDGTGALAASAAAPLDALSGGVALVSGAVLADQLAGLSAAVPAALAAAADSAADPAIGPGPLDLAPAQAADPRAAAGVLLAAPALLQPRPGELKLGAALLLTARVQAVCAAARAASGAAWDSRDEAVLWRARVDLGLAIVQGELAAAGAGAAWRALREVRTAWARDMTEAIGRLPPVRHLQTRAPLSAWQIALAVAGDVPAAIRPAMLDFVRRNRIRHPGLVQPGRFEVVGGDNRPFALEAQPMLTVPPGVDRADAVAIGGAVLSIGGETILATSLAPVPDPQADLTVSIGGASVAIAGELIRADTVVPDPKFAPALAIGGAVVTLGGEPIAGQ